MVIKKIFELERKPRKGLLAIEWVILAYMLFTLLLMLITYTKLQNPEAMLWGRARFLVMTLALWGVYRMVPCRFTMMCRVGAQMALLSWWYPDTYEFNRMFHNLDHVFAGYEQQLFHMQPALLFSQKIANPVFSELMHLGYASYYPLIIVHTKNIAPKQKKTERSRSIGRLRQHGQPPWSGSPARRVSCCGSTEAFSRKEPSGS